MLLLESHSDEWKIFRNIPPQNYIYLFQQAVVKYWSSVCWKMITNRILYSATIDAEVPLYWNTNSSIIKNDWNNKLPVETQQFM